MPSAAPACVRPLRPEQLGRTGQDLPALQRDAPEPVGADIQQIVDAEAAQLFPVRRDGSALFQS